MNGFPWSCLVCCQNNSEIIFLFHPDLWSRIFTVVVAIMTHPVRLRQLNVRQYVSQQQQQQQRWKVCTLKYVLLGMDVRAYSIGSTRPCLSIVNRGKTLCVLSASSPQPHDPTWLHITQAQHYWKTYWGVCDYLTITQPSLGQSGSHWGLWQVRGSLVDPCRSQLVFFSPFPTLSPSPVCTNFSTIGKC